MRQRFGVQIVVLGLILALALVATTTRQEWSTASAQDGTPSAVPAEEIPTVLAEPVVPLAAEPTPEPVLTPPSAPALEAAVDATLQSSLDLQVDTPSVSFGKVSADGAVDPAVSELTSQLDDRGAYYVKADAIHVTVRGDAPWTGICHAAENVGSAAGIRIADGRLEWRLAGSSTWTPFAIADPATGEAPVCFEGDGGDIQAFAFDLRLRVEATDGPGDFSTVLTFQVLP